ncbi:MAG: SRPBCC family protein [Nocardioidaceae bacterium]|nr:SRPBCC family protein [Nocardioidaceae bacterium]
MENTAIRSRHVSCLIDASPEAVYAFASTLSNLPLWAAGLAEGNLEQNGDVVRVDSPMGSVTVRFAPRNEHGILDHDVTLPSGTVAHNPLRVLAHPHGAEVVFTVRQIELSDEEFERDAQMVAADLQRLKQAVESVASATSHVQ